MARQLTVTSLNLMVFSYVSHVIHISKMIATSSPTVRIDGIRKLSIAMKKGNDHVMYTVDYGREERTLRHRGWYYMLPVNEQQITVLLSAKPNTSALSGLPYRLRRKKNGQVTRTSDICKMLLDHELWRGLQL